MLNFNNIENHCKSQPYTEGTMTETMQWSIWLQSVLDAILRVLLYGFHYFLSE